MIYLRKFENYAAYEAAKSSLILPNVSLITETNGVAYNPYVPKSILIGTINVTTTEQPTPISFNMFGMDGTSGFSEIEIDDVIQPTIESAYTFSTTGEHTVKYTLKDPTTIGANAFEQCWSLKGISIPNTVSTLNNRCFTRCGLSNLTIPSSVTYIGDSMFEQAWNMTLTVEAPIPPNLGMYVFDMASFEAIYVPSDSVDVYKAASGWSDYASYIQAIS